MTELILTIKHGDIQTIYDERLDLSNLGAMQITRASTVDPDENNQWWADMALSGSTQKLGPFTKRSEALEAERTWLLKNHF